MTTLPFGSISPMETGLLAYPDLYNSSNYESIGLPASAASCSRYNTLTAVIEDLSHNFIYSLLSLGVTVATVGCVVIGFLALYKNGVAQSTSFSSMLLTTRSRELDELAFGHWLGLIR
ncbi:hypothetical protein BDV12DRAFT_198062 [Aspergillus spectabilis]